MWQFIVIAVIIGLLPIVFFKIGRKHIKRQKDKLDIRIKVIKGNKFYERIKQRDEHTNKIISKEEFEKPIIPDRVNIIEHTNEWDSFLDLNPNNRRNKNWIGFTEYLSILEIENENTKQVMIEKLLAMLQKMVFNSSGIPIPLTWFLPKKFTKGSLSFHIIQIIQSTLIITPSILTTIGYVKNFNDNQLPKKLEKKMDHKNQTLESKLPSTLKLESIYDYAIEKPSKGLVPVNEKLFPGLFKGFAPHNPPVFSGDKAKRNIVFAAICNRFFKNISILTDLQHPGT